MDIKTVARRSLRSVLTQRTEAGELGYYRFAYGWDWSSRIALVNHLICLNGYRSYLEIGVRDRDAMFNRISVADKTCVDPDPQAKADFEGTSDAFFAGSKKTFDIIFIDGLHTGEQVARDLTNALAALDEGGAILLHDMNPPTAFHARETYEVEGQFPDWNGTSWQGFAEHRKSNPDLEMYVVDTDWGVGFVRPGRQDCYDGPVGSYADLDAHRQEILQLIPVREFLRRHPAR
ncbi:MAG: class I SAM-dependent methyltransferase [Tropicimonas sp.]|uniref:class I SAM-dependent methyltransferase n=1 Tax=Tropicimonas sp. TaxID=2067044 RepID=UPI003A872E09